MITQRSALLEFALDLAALAAHHILPRFQSSIVHFKSDGSVVTEADKIAEREMRREIGARYPSYGILGEEEGETIGSEDRQWVIDPIDGTTRFALGVPTFGTLIALIEEGKPRLGVIHLPVTGESLYAETGAGCWYIKDGLPPVLALVDNKVTALANALASLSGVDCSELREGEGTRRYRLGKMMRDAGSIEFIGDCIQHLLVAKGCLHVAIDAVMRPWDSAAIVPCVREAGGVVSTADGDYENVVFGGSLVSSSDLRLHEEVLRVINWTGSK